MSCRAHVIGVGLRHFLQAVEVHERGGGEVVIQGGADARHTQGIQVAGGQCPSVGVGLRLAGQAGGIEGHADRHLQQVNQGVAILVYCQFPILCLVGKASRHVVCEHDFRMQVCTVLGHRAPLRRQHEVFRRGHVDAVDAHHVDIVAGDDVGGLLVDRRYRLHTVNASERLQCLVVQQRLASVVAGGRRHVDLCQAAQRLDALAVRLFISETHGDQHHDTHDAHRHG